MAWQPAAAIQEAYLFRPVETRHPRPTTEASLLFGVDGAEQHAAIPPSHLRSMDDLDAAFDAALNLEEAHKDEGWDDGLRYATNAAH
jgi:hypothetical protein